MTIYNLISIYFLLMIYAAVYWAVHIRAFNEKAYALAIHLLSAAFFVYLIGYTLQLNVSTESQMLFWNRFQYFGIPYVSSLWLLSGLLYTNHFSKHKVRWLLFVFIIPVLTMFLRFTNEWHHLYFASVSFVDRDGKLLLERTYGPWMYVQTVHSMSMIWITLALYLKSFICQEQNREKVIFIVLASLVAVVGLVLSVLDPFSMAIDYMAVCLPLSCLMVLIAVWRYDFLEAKAIARSEAFESNRDAMLLVKGHRIIDYNRQAKRLFEKMYISLSEGQMESILKESPRFLKSLKALNDMTVRLELENQVKVFEISTQNIDKRSASRGVIKTICDVTEAYDLNKSLQKQAMMDVLSGVYNRRAFMEKSERIRLEAEKNKQSLHLLMMDLDHFKYINDQYGHQTGDQVIKYIGTALKNTFQSGALIARLGGEEFAVMLTGFSDDEVYEKAKGFLKAFAAHSFSGQNEIFHVTVSIGSAKKSESQQPVERLIHMADKALYQAKEQGRNRLMAYCEEREIIFDRIF